jgi:hypothetical protein
LAAKLYQLVTVAGTCAGHTWFASDQTGRRDKGQVVGIPSFSPQAT